VALGTSLRLGELVGLNVGDTRQVRRAGLLIVLGLGDLDLRLTKSVAPPLGRAYK
jgi:hypothetical protein